MSLHEPDARPIAKGRLGKPVEWATIALGWFFSGAFLAAVTGLFKPDE